MSCLTWRLRSFSLALAFVAIPTAARAQAICKKCWTEACSDENPNQLPPCPTASAGQPKKKQRATESAGTRPKADDKDKERIRAHEQVRDIARAKAEALKKRASARQGSENATPATCARNQVAIPGGTFMMGSKDGKMKEGPVHQVTLSPFCIDKTEVTVAAYRACVEARDCKTPKAEAFGCTWGKSGMDQHPINCVDWSEAKAFCEWANGRLPTEAEWEFAARGTDGRKYPWGPQDPAPSRLNMGGKDDGWEYTAPVGSYPRGASPFGVLDMAGNVWEWTADACEPYRSGAETNPVRSSPDASSLRVFRGGSWHDNAPSWVRTAFRNGSSPGYRIDYLGFRCARGAKK
jgi:formylglycine-generating enzyme required for sulfatase activity